VTIYDALGERFAWEITRDNAGDVAEAFREALPACMETVPLEDNRTTPEQDAERLEQRAQETQARAAIAAEKSDTVEQLAEELRKQYPDAISADSGKSSHARAGASLKRILQAQGLRVSVKSSSFSMGNSVRADIKTPDLLPAQRDEVQALCDRFTYGTFDPMTDCSGYDHSEAGEAWELVHGRAKYCRAEFTQSDENRAAIVAFLGGDESEAIANGRADYQIYSGAHPRAAEFWEQWTATHAAPESEAVAQGAGYSIEKHHHTKRGFDFWLVVLADRVEREQFEALRDSCKAAGGWYSRQWKGTPGGFGFTEQEAAAAWAIQEFSGPDGVPPDTQPPPKPKQDTHKADKFREMAEKLEQEVTAKRGDHRENTPKQQREGMSRRIDADRLERTAQALRALADLMEAGPLPQLLAKFTSKKAVFSALGVRTVSSGYYHVAATDERSDTGPEAVALWGLLEGKSPEQERAEQLHNMQKAAQGAQIAGYYSTPEYLVEDMILKANITAGLSVLEPSAGSGAITDQLADLYADPLIVVHEINPTLCDILRAKGFDVRPGDFLEAGGSPQSRGNFRFDRVVMNPPFENLQDIDHVMHAFSMLKQGGRLVSIMSPGPFFRDTGKAKGFRMWFDALGGEVEDIEAGTFKESGTGVAAKLVVIDKPAEEEPARCQAEDFDTGQCVHEEAHAGDCVDDCGEPIAGPCNTCGAPEGETHPPSCADLIEAEDLPAEAPSFEISEQPSLF